MAAGAKAPAAFFLLFRTATGAKQREVPNSAKSQTAFNVVWNLAPFGILRRQGFCAVWDFASFVRSCGR